MSLRRLRRFTVTFLVCFLCQIQTGTAQLGADAINPDAERLILPLSDTVFLALPGQAFRI